MVRGRQTLTERVLNFIQQHHLVPSQQQILVAVSGGPDSVCLLHMLVKLQNELGVKLHVAHLDHQLRGAESAADARYVAELSHRLGIPASIERRDVKAYQARQRISLEEAAREVRYAFLAQVASTIGASRVAVGHTANDHIETILMHLIRGTGTKGLRGLKPSNQWQSVLVIRPLLEVSREETADYCHYHQLMPRIDSSNLSLSPLRNRIRQQLIPLLQSYNPQVADALLRTARIASDDLTYLDGEVARLWEEVALKQEGSVTLDKNKFVEIPSALRRHLLRAAIERLLGNLKDIEMRHIEEIMNVLSKPAGRRISLPGGLIFSVEYDRYLLAPDPATLSPFPVLKSEFPLKIPGEAWLSGWHIEATIIDRKRESDGGEAPLTNLPPPFPREGDKGGGLPNNGLTAYFDLDRASNKLVVRSRQPGDRFQPLGMSQPKKLGEFMIDAKIPHSWRERVPLVCSPQQILWVVGWRIDDRVKVTRDTSKILCVKFERH